MTGLGGGKGSRKWCGYITISKINKKKVTMTKAIYKRKPVIWVYGSRRLESMTE